MIEINQIEYYLPEKCLLNDDFSSLGVSPEFLKEKIGIERRHISAADESVGDMAEQACLKLLAKGSVQRDQIDILILCTQNPDYVLPTTACILQHKLGLSTQTLAFDINLGCSGYVYACAIASSLMKNFGRRRALVVTAEAYSKVISYTDKTVATLFSDGAAATLLVDEPGEYGFLSFDFGTDGSGFSNLIVPVSGSRTVRTTETAELRSYGDGISRSQEHLYMNGPEIMKFVFKEIPPSIKRALATAGLSLDQVDRFVFHQANKYMLESLAKRMALPADKLFVDLSMGNTVSSTIPIALKRLYGGNESSNDRYILMSGFGVGYSWASTIMKMKSTIGVYL